MIKQNRQDAERLLELIVREKEDTVSQCVYSTIEVAVDKKWNYDADYNHSVIDWNEEEQHWKFKAEPPADFEIAPVCIVGHVLFALLGEEGLMQAKPENVATDVPIVLDNFDEAAVNYLATAQWYQDHGSNWGEAVMLANSMDDKEHAKAHEKNENGHANPYRLLAAYRDVYRSSKPKE